MVRAVCPTPGCTALVDRGPCPRCRRMSSRNHRGVPRQQRGLGAAHERARRGVIGGPCVLQLPGCTGVATTLEHRVPRSQGGSLEDGYAGACAHCQRAQGAALARAAR